MSNLKKPEELSEAARAALEAGLKSAQEDIASGRPLQAWNLPVEDAPWEAPEVSPSPTSVALTDAVAAFVDAAVTLNRKAFTSTAEIMAAARAWCDENEALPFGPRALAAQLKRRRGVQAHSNGQRRGWRGVKLR